MHKKRSKQRKELLNGRTLLVITWIGNYTVEHPIFTR